MPELPEVETIVRDLDKELKRKKIIAIKSSDKKALQLTGPELESVIGKEIKSVSRRAKMIVFDLAGSFLIIHLKLTGQLVLKTKTGLVAGGHPIANEGRGLPNGFTRVIFKFNDGSELFFNDVRRFGWIKLAVGDDFSQFDSQFGVEPLSPDFTLEYFKKVLVSRPKTAVKQALMDQEKIAGIGNIYADESLFAAGIKPFRRVSTLKAAEIEKLWRAIPKILLFAIKHRGTSFNDYVDAQGEVGNFVRYLKVYGRAGEKCRVCGELVKKMKLGGRGTHWCEHCQG
jgi:formamidopyrimidine-DNA glycosylase